MSQETIDRINVLTGQDFVNIDEVAEFINEQVEIVQNLQEQLAKSDKSGGRKFQVLELLKSKDAVSILDIAKELNITTKNVSSQLTYLRSDGYKIFTDHRGRKVLVQEEQE